MDIQELIQRRFTGELNNEAEYIELLVQVFAVLIIGLLLWRIMIVFHKKKKATRRPSAYFDNTFSKSWKK